MPKQYRRRAIACLFAVLFLACGGKDGESDEASAESLADAEETQAPATAEAPAPSQNQVSAPLTTEDITRWERGMAAEMKAVQDAGAKLKTARTGEDTLSAMMGAQEMNTVSAGAQGAGMEQERYKFVRSNLSAAVAYLGPPLGGMDTSMLTRAQMDEMRQGNEAQLKRIEQDVPADVIEALRPRVAELQKKNLELVGARLKAAGVQ